MVMDALATCVVGSVVNFSVMQIATQMSFSFRCVSICVLGHDYPSFVSSRDVDLLSVGHPFKLFVCLAFIMGQAIALEFLGAVSICAALKDVAICTKLCHGQLVA